MLGQDQDKDVLLTRKEAAAVLSEAGFPITHRTLETYGWRGGGPTYMRFGRCVLYRRGDLLDWARDRLVDPARAR